MLALLTDRTYDLKMLLRRGRIGCSNPSETEVTSSRQFTSTKVMLPRFEYEGKPDPDKLDLGPRLQQRAERHNWLPGVELEALLNPKAIVADYPRQDVKGRWWGVYHLDARRLTLGRLIHSPFTNTTQLYRSWLIDHSYLWDHQAMDGQCSEIVLERLNHGHPIWSELAAIRIDHPHRYSAGQQVVLKNETDDWADARFNQDFPERDFYFAVLIELATSQGLEATVKTYGGH